MLLKDLPQEHLSTSYIHFKEPVCIQVSFVEENLRKSASDAHENPTPEFLWCIFEPFKPIIQISKNQIHQIVAWIIYEISEAILARSFIGG